jgi:hypothetical protein
MPSYFNILVLVVILLSSGNEMAIAGDDNPWSMDEPGGRQSYYDLNSGETDNAFLPQQKTVGQARHLALPSGKRPNESTVSKSVDPSGRKSWQSGPGKGDREQYFGYAGPEPRIHQRNVVPMDRSRFGKFPSLSGSGGDKATAGMSTRMNGSVQFRGQSFGAFPPLDNRKVDRENQRGQAVWRDLQKRRQRPLSAFANVPPPPVPDPVPERVFPYAGYGRVPGVQVPYGTGLAPDPGAFGYGAGLVYGPSGSSLANPGLVDPGMLGLPAPGFMW